MFGAHIEVARILMQESGEDGAADHDVGEAVRIVCTPALAITLPTLLEVGGVGSLIDASQEGGAEECYGIQHDLESEPVLQFGREGDEFFLVAHVEIGDEAQDALSLRYFHLPSCDLLSRERFYCGYRH